MLKLNASGFLHGHINSMTYPQPGSIFPAISGAPSHLFERFWSHVVSDEDGLPLHGSIGFHFWIQDNLRDIEQQYVNNNAGFKRYLLENMVTIHPSFGTGKTSANAERLFQMYSFMKDPTQKFFFIKKGLQCLYLVEKTRPYYYEQGSDEWGRHRIDFKFYRNASGDETIPQKGRGMSTWMSGGMKVVE